MDLRLVNVFEIISQGRRNDETNLEVISSGEPVPAESTAEGPNLSMNGINMGFEICMRWQNRLHVSILIVPSPVFSNKDWFRHTSFVIKALRTLRALVLLLFSVHRS